MSVVLQNVLPVLHLLETVLHVLQTERVLLHVVVLLTTILQESVEHHANHVDTCVILALIMHLTVPEVLVLILQETLLPLCVLVKLVSMITMVPLRVLHAILGVLFVTLLLLIARLVLTLIGNLLLHVLVKLDISK
jgi:hypothetical protein